MFDQLVESEPQGADFKNRRRYFMVSSVVVGILFSTAVVISIFAADYGLGTGNFDLVEMIAPVAPETAEPEIPQPRPPAAASTASETNVATRQVLMARVDDVPPAIPTTISTTQNTQMTRPISGDYRFDAIDSNPTNPGGTVRGNETSGPIGSGLGDQNRADVAKVDREEEETPPPVVKKPEAPRAPISKGVLNGRATSLPKPSYSAAAIAMKAQGQVTVQVTIDESGRVISANAVSGHLMLRPEAERAARNARFSPTYLSDSPVKVTGVITYNFIR